MGISVEQAAENHLAPVAESYCGSAELEAMREAAHYNADLVRRIESAIGDARVVGDFGAGIGTFAVALSNRGRRVIAVEPDADLGRRIESCGVECVPVADAIAQESLDAGYSLNVLEHIDDDASILRQWTRRLKPSAPMYLYVPAFPCLYSEMDRCVGHRRRYTKERLMTVMRLAGLTPISVGYADSLGFFASLWLRARGRSGSINPGMVRLYDRAIFPLSRKVDLVASRLVGKNLWAVGVRRDSREAKFIHP